MVCGNRVQRFIAIGAFLLAQSMMYGYELTQNIKSINPLTQQITLTFKLPEGEYLYKDSLRLTVNNPHIKLTTPTASASPTTFFDETDTVKKEGFTGTVSFTTTAKADHLNHHDTALHAHFLISKIHEAQEKIIPLSFTAAPKNGEAAASTETSSSVSNQIAEKAPAQGQMSEQQVGEVGHETKESAHNQETSLSNLRLRPAQYSSLH